MIILLHDRIHASSYCRQWHQDPFTYCEGYFSITHVYPAYSDIYVTRYVIGFTIVELVSFLAMTKLLAGVFCIIISSGVVAIFFDISRGLMRFNLDGGVTAIVYGNNSTNFVRPLGFLVLESSFMSVIIRWQSDLRSFESLFLPWKLYSGLPYDRFCFGLISDLIVSSFYFLFFVNSISNIAIKDGHLR